MSNQKQILSGIHAMRGYASLLVVFCHAAQASIRFTGADYLKFIMEGGFVGVCFFFVLSGFIMSYVHGNDTKCIDSAKKFTVKRVARVVPIYWIMTSLIFTVLVIVPNLGEESHRYISGYLSSLFFVPTCDGPILRVGWTLVHEMLFYFIFAISFYVIKKQNWIYFLWVIAILFIGLDSYGYQKNSITEQNSFELFRLVLFSPLNLLFLMGISASTKNLASNIGKIKSENRLMLALAAFFCIICAIWYLHESQDVFTTMSHPWIRPILYGIIFLFVIAILTDPRLDKHFKNRINKAFGDASYSIYLVHYHVMAALGLAMQKTDVLNYLPPAFLMILMTTAGVFAGFVFHYLVEKPVTRWISVKTKRYQAS